MHRLLARKSIVALLLAGLMFQLPTEKVYAEEEKQMVVVYENDQGEKAVEASGAAIEEQYDHLSAAAIAADTATIDELKKNPDIKYVEPDSKIKIAESSNVQPIETTVSEQWNLAAIGAPAAWQDGLTGKGVKIAIMDSGIAVHQDLQVAGGISTVDYTASFEDDEGHGTHVAGIIGAKHDGQGIDGIAPDADLFAVKVLDDTGEGYLSDLLEGIDWAISNDMDIINLSMGTADESDALEEAMQKAYQAGILLVAASGNEGAGYPVDYPAAYEPVIAVSATDSENRIAAYASVGDKVEFSAPGTNIISTLPGSDYGIMSGTSQATSHVSALLAILKQQFPADTNEQLRVRLQQYTQDLGKEARDQLYGYGLIKYPAPVQKEEPVSNDMGGSDSDETGEEVKEEKVTTEELQLLANELEMPIEELADLFAAYDFDFYDYHSIDEINDVIYQSLNGVSVHFLLKDAGLDREQLDQQLAAENLTIDNFNSPEELSAYIKEYEQHIVNGENQAGESEENNEEGDTTLNIPVTDDQTDENPVIGAAEADSAEKEKNDSGTVEHIDEPNRKTDEIIVTYKSVGKTDKNDQQGERLPDTASPIGNMIVVGIMLTAAGLLLYSRNRRAKFRSR